MTSLDRRSPLISAACLGAVLAAVMILAYSGGRVAKMTSGDGLFYRYVATHLDSGTNDLDPIVAARGPSLRYGRIALPAMIWVLSAGRPGAMPYTQPLIMVAAAAAIAAAARKLFPDRSPLVAVVPFVAVGLTLAIAGGYTEAVAVAFAAWALIAANEERWVASSVLVALAMLARENAAVVLLGLGAWCVYRKQWRPLIVLACSIIPVAIWHAIVAARFGHLPLADPYLWSGAQTARIPFVSLVRGFYDFSAGATLAAAVHLVAGIAAVRLLVKQRTVLTFLAAAAALQLAAVPLLNWQYAGDTFRLFSFLEVFTLLAVTSVTGTSVSPSPARPAGAG